jgi:CheY-like chemotaxis protein
MNLPVSEPPDWFGSEVAFLHSKMVWKESAMTPMKSKRSRYRYRVLCVDADEFGAYVEATVLRREGYSVVACSDALQAAAIAKAEEIDLAVLSYQMAVMNGAELAAFCKAANPDMKVILVSEWAGVPKRERALADLFVQKSDDMQALLAGVETLLPHNRAQAMLGLANDHNITIRTEN